VRGAISDDRPYRDSYPARVWDYLRFARYSRLGITMILISLGLPLLNIRCVECMRKRTMREQFVQIEDFACGVVDGIAPLMLSVLALKVANGKLVAAKPFIAAVAVETQ
jgi:hypothetical protein